MHHSIWGTFEKKTMLLYARCRTFRVEGQEGITATSEHSFNTPFCDLINNSKKFDCYIMKGSRDNIVGIMTRYELNGPKFEPRWSKNIYNFHSRSYYLEFQLASYKMCKGSLSGGRAFGRWGWTLPPRLRTAVPLFPLPAFYDILQGDLFFNLTCFMKE